MPKKYGPIARLRHRLLDKARAPATRRLTIWWLERLAEKGSLRAIVTAVATIAGYGIFPLYADAIGLLGTIYISSVLFAVQERDPPGLVQPRHRGAPVGRAGDPAQDEESPNVRS